MSRTTEPPELWELKGSILADCRESLEEQLAPMIAAGEISRREGAVIADWIMGLPFLQAAIDSFVARMHGELQ